ncbi:alpha/beta-hydrolase [Cylindrobasidium torrendii FP15055 ss-10]|uniref:Alpha/beta-hydrolase n=1 Tax=Cylindrobasidium torrendii FP15055 ss-10 TaxID=1314674 RepID=A0A0D7BC06_9AGAR|nr:alpha/beta-hydrolase [Cylindrobasidium torrendii FP15055 ss-10]
MVKHTRKVAITYSEIAGIYLTFASLPAKLATRLLLSPWDKASSQKTWRRVISHYAVHYLTHLNIAQLQWIFGNSYDVYVKYTGEVGLPMVIDELDLGAKLMWIGERNHKRVNIFLHGGAFLVHAPAEGYPFWNWMKGQLKDKGVDTGLAALSYALHPEGDYPLPLRQLVVMLNHLIAQGVPPEGITMVGESAGSNLILMLLSHMLHPIPGVEPFVLPPGRKLGGGYLLSPWISVTGTDVPNSFQENNHTDITSADTLIKWGAPVMKAVPQDQIPYMEASHAPDGWFEGSENLINKILITVGEFEPLRDSIVSLYERHFKGRKEWAAGADGEERITYCYQPAGNHNDPYYSFFWGPNPKEFSPLTPTVVDWMYKVHSKVE